MIIFEKIDTAPKELIAEIFDIHSITSVNHANIFSEYRPERIYMIHCTYQLGM